MEDTKTSDPAEVNLSHTLWNQLLLELWTGEFLGQNPSNRVTEDCESCKRTLLLDESEKAVRREMNHGYEMFIIVV